MIYCSVFPDNINKLLEKSFINVGSHNNVIVSRHPDSVFSISKDTVTLLCKDNIYNLDTLGMLVDSPVKMLNLEISEFSSLPEDLGVVSCKEFVGFIKRTSVRFLLHKVYHQDKILGNIFIYKTKESEIAIKEMLKKYTIVELNQKCSDEEGIIRLLIKADKI